MSRDQIVDAALGIARTEGLDALSIRRLAAELGASRMAIYRHVENKDALLDLAAAAIAERDIPLPAFEEGNWQDHLRTIVHEVRESLMHYPGLVELLLSRGSGSPATLAIADRCIGVLRRAGLDPATAARCYAAMFDVVLARAQREQSSAHAPERRLGRLLTAARAVDDGSVPYLREALPSLERMSGEDVAETELELLIAGFETLVARTE